MKSVAVFCGSSMGAHPMYEDGAREFGRELARRGISLVYGGASVGLMGTVADAVLREGGKVIGVMPRVLLDREISHKRLSELVIVETMHERKARMAELAEGFVALPGGPGTFEEFFEVFTWAQIGIHRKPCGLFNIQNYFLPLSSLFRHMIEQGFMQEKYRSMVIMESNPKALLDRFAAYVPPTLKP
jgi:uncharacterized protein (TIGR00730 family)